MCRPFRAPELLFGPSQYSACATDLWSLGCTISHFFTPVRLFKHSYYDDEEDEVSELANEERQRTSPYMLPKDIGSVNIRSAGWTRMSLFDGTRGSIGLAASIFKLRGTPNKENWPVSTSYNLIALTKCSNYMQDFMELPDANKVQFAEFPTKELRPYLPNLPPEGKSSGSDHSPPAEMSPTPLDLIHRLLVYPPKDRISASSVLEHPWFLSVNDPLVLPTDHPLAAPPADTLQCATEWKGETMGHWLKKLDQELS